MIHIKPVKKLSKKKTRRGKKKMKKQADEAAAALAAENEKKALVESLLVKTDLSRSEILTAYDKFYSKYPGGEITKKQFLEESSVRTRT